MVKMANESKQKDATKQIQKAVSAKKTSSKSISVTKQEQPAGKKSATSKKTGVAAQKTTAPSTLKSGRKTVQKEKPVVRYKCKLCGYIYSPLRGEPHNGIPKGTAFDDLPEDYVCPICGMEGKGKIGKWGFEEWRPTRYICAICGYVYDEKRGEPHRNIKPGTRFENLPDTYVCPVCALDPKIKVQFGKVFKQGFSPVE
jgi:rubredoxin